MLIDATMKGDMPPLALPKQAYMERAQQNLGGARSRRRCGRSRRGSAIRSATGCRPGMKLPSAPSNGLYLENGRISEQQKRKGLKPETKFRPGERS